MNFAGHWTGFYEQEFLPDTKSAKSGKQKFGIETWITNDGEQFSGKMKDLDPVFEVLYSEYVAAWRKSYSIIDRIKLDFYCKQHPGLLLAFHLGPDSIIEGSCGDEFVRFTKTYVQPGKEIYRVGDWTRECENKAESILYEGQFYENGEVIKGVYRGMPEDKGIEFSTGYFELRRVK